MSEPFTNAPVDMASIPGLDGDDFVALDRNYLRITLIGMALFALVTTLVCGVIATQAELPWVPLVVLAVVLVLVAVAATLRWFEVRHIGYLVRDHDISFRRGVITRTTSTLPYARVQHARLHRGPLERRFGLATVHVNSAGPDLRVPGLPVADAERITALVVERAGELTEDE